MVSAGRYYSCPNPVLMPWGPYIWQSGVLAPESETVHKRSIAIQTLMQNPSKVRSYPQAESASWQWKPYISVLTGVIGFVCTHPWQQHQGQSHNLDKGPCLRCSCVIRCAPASRCTTGTSLNDTWHATFMSKPAFRCARACHQAGCNSQPAVLL